MAAVSSTFPKDRSVDRTDASLLERLQGVIERTYDLQTGVRQIGRFVIGDVGYRALYGGLHPEEKLAQSVGAASPPGARTLIRHRDGGLAVSIYYPDTIIECLERNDPTRFLDDGNVDAFAVLVEELDHFLVIAERYRSRGVLSLLDLELHANVTKSLMLKLFVSRMRGTHRLSGEDSAWIRFHLFEKVEFCDPDPEIRQRYRTASRLAARYLDWLEKLAPLRRLCDLRRFHRMPPPVKLEFINALPA